MKLVFMGTPDFAVPALTKLYNEGYEIGYVVTQPDSVRDRGKKLKNTKVKEKALELGLDVLQPERIKDDVEVFEKIKKYNPDLIVVVAYGQLLPKSMLEIPQKACINIHGSLLPKLRGAAPIQRAILEGHDVTGITIMEMSEGMDMGDMLAKREYQIKGENAGDLFNALSNIGADLLIECLPKIDLLLIDKIKQNEKDATYAPMIKKEDTKINFCEDAVQIKNRILAMSPTPGAYVVYDEEKIKIYDVRILNEYREKHLNCGQVVRFTKEGIIIAAKDKLMEITELQLQGKKRMLASDFLAGNSSRIKIDDILNT